MTTRLLPLALCLLSISSSAAQAPELVLESRSGQRVRLPLESLPLTDPREREAWLVQPRGFPGGKELLAAAASDERVEVELRSGALLVGRVAEGAGESLGLTLLGDVGLALDVADMRRLVFPQRIPTDRPVGRLEAPRDGDRLYRWTGRDVDPIGGTVEEFTSEGVRFDSETVGSRLYRWDEVAALFVEVLGEPVAPRPETGAAPIELDLIDGSRLQGRLRSLEQAGCRMELAGAEVLFPWAAVDALVVDDGSIRFLSELPAAREDGRGTQFGDELGMVWDHRIDGCVTGGELRTGGRVYRRGIGMHAPTRVTWELDGAFLSLRALVGVDDSALFNPRDAQGSVVFRVLLDGEIAWESGVVRGGDAVLPVPPIPLAGKSELTLEADMVGDFRGDRANWLRVLLFR